MTRAISGYHLEGSVPLIFEKGAAGRRGVPACRSWTSDELPLDELIPAEHLRERAPRAARAQRARRGAALHAPVAAQLRRRRGLLPARLVHDEVQPEGERAARRAAGLRAGSIRTSPRRPSRARCELMYELQQLLARDRRAGAARCSRRPAPRASCRACMVMRAYHRTTARRRSTEGHRSPTRPTAPIRPARRCAATRSCRCSPTRAGSVDLDAAASALVDRHGAGSCSPTPTRWAVRGAICEIADIVHERRRADLLRRRQHERDSRHGPAGRYGLRHHAHQPAQDLLHARTAAAGPARARSRCGTTGAVLARARRWSRTATRYLPRLRPARVDRPHQGVLRQLRHAGAGVHVHPRARARGPARASASRPCSTPTI